MVELNHTELETYTNTFAVAYAALSNSRLSEGFNFPIGKIMLLVKRLADESDTVADLSRKVLRMASSFASNECEPL